MMPDTVITPGQGRRTAATAAAWTRLGFVPGRVLRVFGMRRSGNHAMADWLLRNAPGGNSVFLNNCVTRKNPLGNFRSIAINGRKHPVKPALADLASQTRAVGDGAVLLFSYEDTAPTDFDGGKDAGKDAGKVGGKAVSGDFDETLIDTDLVFYRGFLNWSASLLRKLQANPGYSVTRRTGIVLRAIDTYTRVLSVVEAQADLNVVALCYDDWHGSETFRAQTLDRLGWPVHDTALGAVQTYGGGSSFQKDATEATDLTPDRRWVQMADDPEYQAILALAARDVTLTDRLERVFPQDAARLAAIAASPVLTAGALQ
jgi:hypothetical protein